MLCFEWKWEEEKVQQQSNERGARMFYDISIPANGSMGLERKKFHSVLAEMITLKPKQEYCITMPCLPRKISFSLMRSILWCIRGSRDKNVNQQEMNIANDIEISESLSKVHE